MSNNIEPPILISRLMTFVFASALVVLVVMIITLAKMFPLDRTQVFFLTSQPKENTEIQISDFKPDSENIETYKKAFIKEYIKARNEIVPNAAVMRKKWANINDSIVRAWSTPDVYNNFTKTRMWTAYMNNMEEASLLEFTCTVEFTGMAPRTDNTYDISFRYFCTNSGGQTPKKDYTITVKLELENAIKWTDRLNNPLGIRVAEYKVESGNDDPLNVF